MSQKHFNYSEEFSIETEDLELIDIDSIGESIESFDNINLDLDYSTIDAGVEKLLKDLDNLDISIDYEALDQALDYKEF